MEDYLKKTTNAPVYQCVHVFQILTIYRNVLLLSVYLDKNTFCLILQPLSYRKRLKIIHKHGKQLHFSLINTASWKCTSTQPLSRPASAHEWLHCD